MAWAARPARIPMYQMYNSGYGDWFLTVDPNQRSEAINMYGYTDFGIAFYVDSTDGAGAKPFYRTFKGSPQLDHFYTISAAERLDVLSQGWVDENAEGYLYETNVNGSVAVYRLHLWDEPTSGLMHVYTTDGGSLASLQAQGWVYDGIAGYAFTSATVPDAYKATILAYHSGEEGDCTGYSAATVALGRDLDKMWDNGFTVVPLRWMAQWALGDRASASMPAKPVAITLDDGYDLDYQDGHPSCPGLKSARTVLLEKHLAYGSLFAAPPYATSFVIASPRVRGPDLLGYLKDTWWKTINDEGLIEIQSHSTDHDIGGITQATPETDPHFPNVTLPIGALQDGFYQGRDSFCRIGMPGVSDPTGSISATQEIVFAADYIGSKTLVRPDLFANPVGGMSSGLLNYWQNNVAQHQTYAAFLTGGDYVRRSSTSRYQFPRFLKGGAWTQESQLLPILNGNAGPPTPGC